MKRELAEKQELLVSASYVSFSYSVSAKVTCQAAQTHTEGREG